MSSFVIFSFINPNLFDDSDVITLKLLSKFHSSLFNYDYIDFYRQSILFNQYMLINIKFVFNDIYHLSIPDFSDNNSQLLFSSDLYWNVSLSCNISLTFNWKFSINNMLNSIDGRSLTAIRRPTKSRSPWLQHSNCFLPDCYKIRHASLYINHKEEIIDFCPHIPLNKLFSWNYIPFLSDDNCLHIFIKYSSND